jgi:MTH538 TIR-like domain (DUF1863)
MDEAEAAASPAQYRAFISYSHADSRFAVWLHRRLEGWTVPGHGRLAPIFIDRAELAAGPDLSAQVREALAGSAALIVIASPAARASRWVNQEIALFRELHRDAPVLAALIEGEPAEAFPEILLTHRGAAIEPLAADFREGRDGKRLGLIKIIAGLTGLRLDRLVQRDAQGRQRRVMWITAAALLLSLVLAALLVIALRARSEAERQRAEAEGMVEFMLTDLRDKLKGVGRLDIMDSVNERAMKHYAGEDLRTLPEGEGLRRARLLQAMAEDDLMVGSHLTRGIAEAQESWRVTGTLLNRDPDNPVYIMGHAQSEYYLGYAEFLTRKSHPEKSNPIVLAHWQTYLGLIERLTRKDPENNEWLKELGFAQGNMCTIYLSKPQQPGKALDACIASRDTFAKIQLRDPKSLEASINLTNRMAWEADALAASNRTDEALAIRNKQVTLCVSTARQFPKDARAIEALMLAELGLAQAEQKYGSSLESQRHAREASRQAANLHAIDPNHPDWNWWGAQINQLLDIKP